MGSVASSSLHKRYDVFLSFRGEDTRNNFTSHLYTALCQKSIKTFIDYKVHRGDQISSTILKQIEDSYIALVVFSENYASSKWCLEELVKILACKEDKGQSVIPVFYKIDPSHVRTQSGSYKEAFVKHEKDEDCRQKVLKWKAALTQAANLAGWDSCNHPDESQLVQKIVNDILQKLYRRYPSEWKGLVGIEDSVRHVELLLEKVPIVGIWGMGGIGKTTIAKAVYAKHSFLFESCCFLENVREESQKHGLRHLCDKLLINLQKEENFIGSSLKVESSTFEMRRLNNKKVFIVLDDVISSEQLDYLASECDSSLGSGSRVIITTRDKHLLIGRVDEIHEVKGLNSQNSLKLLSLNAFKENHPKVGYEELSESAVIYAKGIPLVLKVLGSLLHSKSIETWDSTLRKLAKYPNVRIQKVLKLSYDELDDVEKFIFLDIAFFYKGEDKDTVIRLLDACGFYAASGIDTLIDKALVTISNGNRIQIHDLIQQMGWEIVRQESPTDIGRRSRLRDTEEVYNVLKNNQGTDAVEGIILDLSEIGDLKLCDDTFKRMTKLRFLKFHSDKRSCNVYLPSGLKQFSGQLRYLEWNGYPLDSLPSSFCPEKLVKLYMPHSHVQKLWDGLQDFVNLEGIDLYGSKQLIELPDFSKASKLKWTDLSLCESLSYVHPSLLSLHSLVTLRLSKCKSLKTLQSNIHLKSLEYLFVDGCWSLVEFSLTSEKMRQLDFRGTSIKTLSSSIELFSNLEELYLCDSLKNLPNKLSSIKSLKDLSLANCRQLDTSNLHILLDASRSLRRLCLNYCHIFELPHNINVLSWLHELRLDGSSAESLPSSIKHLSGLQILSLRDCKRLCSLPELPPSIKKLDACNCISLETVFTIATFRLPKRNDNKRFLFQNCVKLDEHSVYGIVEHAHFTMKEAAYGNVLIRDEIPIWGPNDYNRGAFCLPGSRVPDWFKYQTKEASLTVDFSSSSDLLGFLLSVVFGKFPSNEKYAATIGCECYLVDGGKVGYTSNWYNTDITQLKSDHVYLWYDPFFCDMVLMAVKERGVISDHSNIYNPKVSFKFVVTIYKCGMNVKDHGCLIGMKECGVCPIYASEHHSFMNQMKLELKYSDMTKRSREEQEKEHFPPTKRLKESSMIELDD
ncbi:disease resistance-like protein DSC1 [Abrus precatorius]|uniref:ADP-ribosyl cyclase/cyclic ADP-ribose hydrolase n=1 Tax=Abrus precatorius TaxID=3816 RepID=A0A8B8JY98_ABRPR|nr:disease resistance-like protein DSC1 [Abrus precatorius]